jgi:pimeloyl-ACP methyl ester carboxylesterase
MLDPKSRSCPVPVFLLIFASFMLAVPPQAVSQVFLARAEIPASRRSNPLEQALSGAGANRTELVKALQRVPRPQRPGLEFLLQNMPQRDLQSLSASFLLENLELAYQAMETAPWSKNIPSEIFLNDILPYATLNEKREAWRKTLSDQCAPLVKDCQTPAEAAQRLNQKLFHLVKVKYSTQRRKAAQSPLESIESGLASCTGLSILLVDACRSVGVPARVVGIPNWVDNRGNHTWVEIWDQKWHFTGAAEQDPKGLDRGWFAHDASKAIKDSKEHAIYATSFKKTPLPFPMVWASALDYVSAVNVTDQYARQSKPSDLGKMRLMVKVLDHPGGQRVATKVRVSQPADPTVQLEGMSKDETCDRNDILGFELPKQRTYGIEIQQGGRKLRQEVAGSTNSQELVVVYLREPAGDAVAPPTDSLSVQIQKPLKPRQEASLKKEVAKFFAATPEKQAGWKFGRSLESLLKEHEPAARRIVWETYRAAPIHEPLKQDYEEKQVRFQKHLSPYTVKTVGREPDNGWPLFIAMHGGGGAPKEVNDSQWKVMQKYYHDQTSVTGYLYVALRAPNDSWNGFYADYVYPLVANLIEQFLVFGEVDPNKVFIMGYSHGGYGAFAIGPKMPDRFAAIHSSAAAPTDGETSPKTLRNTIFTYMVGENDTAYGRIERCKKFNASIEKLRGDRADIYPVTLEVKTGFGHGGLPDREKIKEMYPAVRNAVPRELTWQMTDGVIQNFFWLQVPKPAKGQEIEAICRGNRVTVNTTNVAAASLLLDSRLIDFQRPVTIEFNGRTSTHKLQPSLLLLCQTLLDRGDPDLAFTAKVDLQNRR